MRFFISSIEFTPDPSSSTHSRYGRIITEFREKVVQYRRQFESGKGAFVTLYHGAGSRMTGQ